MELCLRRNTCLIRNTHSNLADVLLWKTWDKGNDTLVSVLRVSVGAEMKEVETIMPSAKQRVKIDSVLEIYEGKTCSAGILLKPPP